MLTMISSGRANEPNASTLANLQRTRPVSREPHACSSGATPPSKSNCISGPFVSDKCVNCDNLPQNVT